MAKRNKERLFLRFFGWTLGILFEELQVTGSGGNLFNLTDDRSGTLSEQTRLYFLGGLAFDSPFSLNCAEGVVIFGRRSRVDFFLDPRNAFELFCKGLVDEWLNCMVCLIFNRLRGHLGNIFFGNSCPNLLNHVFDDGWDKWGRLCVVKFRH